MEATVVILQIWEFNDVNNTGIFDPTMPQCIPFDTSDMRWIRGGSIQSESEIMLKIISRQFGKDNRKGNVIMKVILSATIKVLQTRLILNDSFQFDLFPYTSYAMDLPRLIHTANSTLIDIVLDNMSTTKQFLNSRFAIELMLIGAERSKDTMKLIFRKGLDDEHTPGVFEIIELLTPQTVVAGNGGFLQYRPISYVRSAREVATSTKVNTNPLFMSEIPIGTTAYKYFANFKSDFDILSESFSVSMGDKDDGFYQKTRYNIWFVRDYSETPF
jgi:hypothetical protein